MAFIQSASGGFAVSSPVAYPSNNAAGNFLVTTVQNFNTLLAPTISDSQGNVWVQVDTFLNGGSGANWLFVAFKCKAGANTVTVGNGNTQMRVLIAEYSDNVSGYAQKNHATGTGAAINTGSVTTNTANSLLIFYGANLSDNTAVYTGTNGFTNRLTNNAVFLEDQSVSVAGTYAGTCTISSSPNWSGGIAVFPISAPAFVQGRSLDAGNAGITGVLAFSANNTVGDLLVCVAFFQNNTGTFSITDSQGNTWVPIYNNTINIQHTSSWYCLNCKGGANTVTVTNVGGSANWVRLSIGEWSGVPATATVEGPTTFASGASSTTITTANLTTTGAQDLIIAIESQVASPASASINNSFVPEFGSGNANFFEAWFADRVGAAGTYSATVTYNISTFSGAGLIAFNTVVISSISGNAGTAGATIAYTGTASGSVVADGSGNYSITGLLNGSYTLTPSLAGFTFSPVSSNQTISGSNITGVNFTATPTSTGNNPSTVFLSKPISVTLVNSSGAMLGFTSPTIGAHHGQPITIVFCDGNGNEYATTGATVGGEISQGIPVVLCNSTGQPIVPPFSFTSNGSVIRAGSGLTGTHLGQPTPVVLASGTGYLYGLVGLTSSGTTQSPTAVVLTDKDGNVLTGTIAV